LTIPGTIYDQDPVVKKEAVKQEPNPAVKSEVKPEIDKTKVKKVKEVKKSNSTEKIKKVKKSKSTELTKVNKPVTKEASVVAQKVTKEKPKTKKKSTSRFRRKPAFTNKMKGTIVAEFPKRLVIKYRGGSPRDPFASLLDKDAGNDDKPNAQKIPDIETSRLVGVLESSDGKNRALLEDVDGYGYILKSGDKVKKGYVSKIYSNKALFQLFEYGWSRTVALRLNEN